MNKFLRSMTRFQPVTTANQDRISSAPAMIDLNIRIDADTWRYFEYLDEDSRTMIARVLKDYVQRQQ